MSRTGLFALWALGILLLAGTGARLRLGPVWVGSCAALWTLVLTEAWPKRKQG